MEPISYVWSVVIALAIIVVGSYRIVPAANARIKETEAVHEDLRRFEGYALMLLAACQKLRVTASTSELSYAKVQLLRNERERWTTQVDEATTWMIDNLERVAFSYLNWLGHRDLLVRYSFLVRKIWISERVEDERCRMVAELAGPVQTIFFVRPRWRSIRARHEQAARLKALLDRFDEASDRSFPSSLVMAEG